MLNVTLKSDTDLDKRTKTVWENCDKTYKTDRSKFGWRRQTYQKKSGVSLDITSRDLRKPSKERKDDKKSTDSQDRIVNKV